MKKNIGRILGVVVMLFVMGMTVYGADAGDIKVNRVFQVNRDVELHESPDETSAVTAALPNGTPVIVKEDANEGWCKIAYQEQAGYVQVSCLAILGSPVTPAAAESPAVPASGAQQGDGAVQGSEVQPDTGAEQNGEIQPDAGTVSKDGADQDSEVQPGDEAVQDNKVQPAAVNDTASNGSTLDDEFKIIQEENMRAYQAAEAAKEQVKSSRIWGIVIAVLVVAIFAVGIVTALGGNKGKRKK